MILSLLVGSLLVGRQIVDRAKIHKVISEIEYYENIFQQFYDTYREVPGSFTYNTCMKYSEFEGYECNNANCIGAPDEAVTWRDHPTWCNLFGIRQSVPSKIVSGHGYSDDQIPAVMRASKLLTGVNHPRRSGGTGQQYPGILNASSGWSATSRMMAVYDPNVTISYRGILQKFFNNYVASDAQDGHSYILRRLVNKNIIKFDDGFVSGMRRARHGSALSSKMMSELDAKIDDGRPISGKVMATRGNAANGLTDPAQLAKYCYDKAGDQTEKAIYNSDENKEFGCNIIKVMEDVK